MNTHCFFVVLDPTRENQPALERALQLAENRSVKLVAFACNWLDEGQMGPYSSRQDAKHSEQTQLINWANEKLAPARKQGIKVELEHYWNEDWHQGVLTKAEQCSADIIFKSTFPHSAGQRLLHKTSDYTLLRKAHCPVLLVHEGNSGGYRQLLAAVDLSGDEAHEQLNGAIMEHAKSLWPNCTLHIVSALDKGPIVPAEPGWVPVARTTPELGELARELGVAKENIHLHQGSPKTVLVDAVADLNIDLLVMGSMARTGIPGVLIGNTAERVLDSVPCDLLIVNKP